MLQAIVAHKAEMGFWSGVFYHLAHNILVTTQG